MNKPLLLSLTLLAVGVPALPLSPSLAEAAPSAQTQPGTPASTPWTRSSLQAATYVVLAPSLEGHPATLNPDQQKSVLAAMQRDLQGAMSRKYPSAHFVSDPATPGAITLRPVLTVPGALLPWNTFQARVELRQGGMAAVVQDSFGVLEVYQHQADAANYLFDRLASKLP